MKLILFKVLEIFVISHLIGCRFGKDYEEELVFECIDAGQWTDVDGNPAYVPDCSSG